MTGTRLRLWRSTATFRVRIMGVAFFVVVALFLWTTIAIYNKQFVRTVDVDLLTDSVGNALTKNADVKARGVRVGEVRSSRADEGQVTLQLAIDPAMAEKIPSNSTARLLPKTLFGERYVALLIPEDNPAEPIHDAVVLHQDSSGNAVEVSALLDDLLPLLQAIPPQDLANTLGALSQALSGKGKTLGETLDKLDDILAETHKVLPDLRAGLHSFAEVAVTYGDGLPQLVDALDNLRTTNATIVQRRTDIDVLLAVLTPASASTADFLQVNRDNIIDVAADARPALEQLATYSPTYACALRNFAQIRPRIDEIMGMGSDRPGSRVTIELTNTRGRYLPNQDEPRWLDPRGPSCTPEFPLGTDAGQYFGGPYNDGSYKPPSRNPGGQQVPTMPEPQFGVYPAAKRPSIAGSPFERQTLGAVYGATAGVSPEQVPSWLTRVAAPAFRGSGVSLR